MEEFVTYEIAKQLKEKGFSGNCFAYYNEEGKLNPIDTDFINFRDIGENNTKAPLWEQAINWLEDIHNLDVETYMNYHVDDDNNVSKIYGCLVLQLEHHQIIFKNKNKIKYNSRKEAIKGAILDALNIINYTQI